MKSAHSFAELEKTLENAGMLNYEQLTSEDIEMKYFQNLDDMLHAFEHKTILWQLCNKKRRIFFNRCFWFGIFRNLLVCPLCGLFLKREFTFLCPFFCRDGSLFLLKTPAGIGLHRL